jgi:hypothetical protein
LCRYDRFRKEREGLPKALLYTLLELSYAPKTLAPDRLPPSHVFLHASLVQTSAPCLRVRYYTPKLAVAPLSSLLSSYSQMSFSGSNHCAYVQQPVHALQSVLEQQLRGSAALAEMLKRLKPLSLTLSNVLQKVEAPKDLPEQPQPAGFSAGIQLHDYQRCARAISACADTLVIQQQPAKSHCSNMFDKPVLHECVCNLVTAAQAKLEVDAGRRAVYAARQDLGAHPGHGAPPRRAPNAALLPRGQQSCYSLPFCDSKAVSEPCEPHVPFCGVLRGPHHALCLQKLFYSPLLGKVSEDVPAGPRGGFLAEEMGALLRSCSRVAAPHHSLAPVPVAECSGRSVLHPPSVPRNVLQSGEMYS